MHRRTAVPAQEAPETAGKTIRWARVYDAVTWLLSAGQMGRIRRRIVDLAEVKPGEKVLDVGCGTGSLALAVGGRTGPSGQVHGIDAAPEMVRVAREKAASKGAAVDFRVGLIEEIPFPDGTFDLTLSTLMLHHLPEDLKRKGLREMRRVLAPGGRALIVDLRSQDESFVGHLLSLVPGHSGRSRAEEVKSMLREAGFATVEELSTGYRQLMFLKARLGGGEVTR